MPNTALNRTTQTLMTNKSGGSVAYGAVVIVDTTTDSSFTTTTTSGLSTSQVGIVIEPNGIANNALGMVAVGGWCPRITLNTASTRGQFIKTHSVAGQGTPHSSPQVEGDFAIALEASTTPACNLFGSPNGPLTGGSGTVTHTAGALTANAVVIGNASADIAVLASLGTAGWVLTSAGAGVPPVFQAPAASGAWTQLAQIVTSASQSSVDFTSISGSYNSLVIIWQAQDTTANNDSSVMRLRINNDSTSGNYASTARSGSVNGVNFSNATGASTKGGSLGVFANASNTGIAATGMLYIASYAGTTWHKYITGTFGNEDGANGIWVGTTSFRWKSTAAVTRATVLTDGTAFTNGSVFTLYGIL